jgi:predicted DNA-binding WGR domain protein
MMQGNNMVAHYQGGTSDKVYMACVRKVTDQNGAELWEVIGKWGRRGKGLSSAVKLRTASETQARMEQGTLFRSKLKEGYEDIDSGGYGGPVSRSTPGIQQELEEDTKAPTVPKRQSGAKLVPKPAVPKKEKEPDSDDLVAVCVDPSGLDNKFGEKLFDEGIEYVFENHADKTMLWVYDKFGEKRECFKERFRLVKAS